MDNEGICKKKLKKEKARDWCIGITVVSCFLLIPLTRSFFLFCSLVMRENAFLSVLSGVAVVIGLFMVLSVWSMVYAWKRYRAGAYGSIRRLFLVPFSVGIISLLAFLSVPYVL